MGDCHARFCESPRVKSPRATHLTTTKSTKLASLGRRTAVKTFTPNNNKSVEPPNSRQATTQRIATQQSCVAWFMKPLALAITLVLAALAFSVSPALAETHPFLSSFGSFTNPNGIAVDESSGDVYVADIGTDTVYKFDANGNPIDFSTLGSNALTGGATPAGSFFFPSVYGNPAELAVDNSTSPADPSRGDLYVMDAGHGVIDKFTSAGEFLGQIDGLPGFSEEGLLGLAVDSTGVLRVDLLSGGGGGALSAGVGVDEFDDAAANRLIAEQVNTEPGVDNTGVPRGGPEAHGFAVGPTGDDFLLYHLCGCVAKFGQHLAGLGDLDSEESGDVALATDPASGHVFIDSQSSVAEWDTGALNGGTSGGGEEGPAEGLAVLLGERFGSAQLSASSGQGGIAVNGQTGQIYVSNPADGKIYVFGSTAPALTVSPPVSVTRESATLTATINPRGAAVTRCEFEYGVADLFGKGAYDQSVPCEPDTSAIGAGTSPVSVSANIIGLAPGLLYRYRVRAANADAPTETSGLLATTGEGFGVKLLEVAFLNEDGTPDTQAGSHPFEVVNNVEFKSHFARKESNADSLYVQEPNGTVKNLFVDLPPGFSGDPNATTAKCTVQQLITTPPQNNSETSCPAASEVGRVNFEFSPNVAGGGHRTDHKPVNVMVPPRGTALQLGINYFQVPLLIDNSVQPGGDYPVQASVLGAPPEAPLLSSRLQLHGVVGEGPARKPFLTLPTGCHGPLRSSIVVESYEGARAEASEVTRNSSGQPVSLTGCSKLFFPPSISVTPDSTDASTSSGLTVGVHVPQTAALNPDGLAESALRDTTVTLPQGVAINPAGGDGLEACSESLAGFTGLSELNAKFEPGVQTATFTPELPNPTLAGVNFCPDGSKVGTVTVKTPLLEHALEGAVYIATQNANPFGSLIAMYMIFEDPISGSLIKLSGEVQLTETGQIVTTFKNAPDLPFEELELHFFGGERAPLATPSRCGTYTTKAVFTPWDGNGPVTSESSFNIEHGPHGGPCPGANLPFDPSVNAGATNIQAGAFSPLTVTVNRKDGEQNLKSLEAKLPPGLSGVLTGVELCPEPQANEGLCGESSKVGEATIGVGVGNDPFTVTGGKFYLTGPYNGHGSCTVGEAGCAPFGLTFEVPAKAGPFDLANTKNNHPPCDCVVVRGKIELSPLTSAITITSNPPGSPDSIPTSIEGIPLEIQHVNATTTRGDFQFNPTNCSKMALTGTVQLSEGGTSTITTPFQVTNCAALKFEPRFSVSTSGKTSRANGASLTAKLTYPNVPQGTEADIAKVKVELPGQLPSRLTTLQKACTAGQFEANPAACPAASKIGYATVHTPLIPVPLQGPAIFVSHGGEAFPSLTLVLQGYGITIDLVGTTFIDKAGITSTTFKTVPDQPFSSFELTLPEGPYSALTNAGNLCSLTKTVTVKKKVTVRVHGRKKTITRGVKQTEPATLAMPTEFVAQNGAEIKQSTPITVTGCPKQVKHKKTARHGRRARKARGGRSRAGGRKG